MNERRNKEEQTLHNFHKIVKYFFKNMLKKFIHRNEEFTCSQCGFQVKTLKKSCRNHCPKCLYSLHVDKESPGDRLSNCFSLMKPIKLEYSGKKGYIIVHQCEKCKKTMKNKIADDDNFEKVIGLNSAKFMLR